MNSIKAGVFCANVHLDGDPCMLKCTGALISSSRRMLPVLESTCVLHYSSGLFSSCKGSKVLSRSRSSQKLTLPLRLFTRWRMMAVAVPPGTGAFPALIYLHGGITTVPLVVSKQPQQVGRSVAFPCGRLLGRRSTVSAAETSIPSPRSHWTMRWPSWSMCEHCRT